MRWGALLLLVTLGCTPDCEDGLVCVLGGTGELGFNGDGLPALETRLASPTSVTVDPEGRPVVVDYSNMRVRVLTDDGRLETIAGNGTHAYSQIGADALDSPLENPVDAAFGPDGLLYIQPQHEGRLIRVGDDGTLERVVGTGMLEDGPDDVPVLDAAMGFGGGFAFDDAGHVLISDNTFSRLRRADLEGAIDTVLGTGKGGSGPPGFGPDSDLRSPERVVVDPARGRALIADAANHRVLALDLDTLACDVIAGTGSPGYSGDGGPAEEATLYAPTGLAVTPEGEVFIADMRNHAIRRVRTDGTIDTVIHATGEPVDVHWPDAFPLTFPGGLALTPDGDLLIAEFGGHRLLTWRGARDAE